MFHIFKKGVFRGSSTNKITQKDCITVEADFSQEELEKIEKGYLYIDGKFVLSEQAIESEVEKIKSSCWEEILAKYSLASQSNAQARATEIIWDCVFETRKPTGEEQVDIDYARSMKAWISEKRSDCKEKIAGFLKNAWVN